MGARSSAWSPTSEWPRCAVAAWTSSSRRSRPGPAPAEPFDLVISAQAWHWVDQDVGPSLVADALRPGGRFALISNGYGDRSGKEPMAAVYEQHAPQIIDKTFVLGRPAPTLGESHRDPIDACGRFGPIEERAFAWEHTYTRDEWLDQIPTHSDHRTLPPDVLATLLEHVGALIDADGGTLTIPHDTELLLDRPPVGPLRDASSRAP